MSSFIGTKIIKKVYPDWCIEPNVSIQASQYWKWFVGHYINKIAEEFDAKVPTVPPAWTILEWEAVKYESIDQNDL